MDVQVIAVKDIKIHSNSRKLFNEKADLELLESIKEKGVIQPIIIRKNGVGYLLVCGERRLKATKAAGIDTIPAVIRELSDQEATEIQLIENIQRDDLNIVDESEAFAEFIKKRKCTIDDLSKKVGKSPTYISLRLQVATLSKKIKDLLREDLILPGHAIVLSRLADEKARDFLIKKIIKDKLSVKVAENYLEELGFSLKEVKFDQTECKLCEYNGKTQEDLFDKDTKLNKVCLDAPCFNKKQKEYVDIKIVTLEKAGNQVIMLDKLEKKTDKSHYSFIDLGQSYRLKDLKSNFKETCMECKKRFYAIQISTYGEDKGIASFKHVCTDEKCYKNMTTVKAGASKSADKQLLQEKKQKQDRKNDNLLNDVSRKFWVGNLVRANSQKERNAMVIDILIQDLSYTKREGIPHLKQSTSYTSWKVKTLYELTEKQQQDIIAFIISRNVEKLVNSDLRFLCGQVGSKISTDYVIDRDYLKRKTKDQLIVLAKEIGLEKFLKDQHGSLLESIIKKGDLVEAFFKKGFKLKGNVPAEIKKLDVVKKK